MVLNYMFLIRKIGFTGILKPKVLQHNNIKLKIQKRSCLKRPETKKGPKPKDQKPGTEPGRQTREPPFPLPAGFLQRRFPSGWPCPPGSRGGNASGPPNFPSFQPHSEELPGWFCALCSALRSPQDRHWLGSPLD